MKDRGFTPHLALFAVQLMFASWPIVGKVELRSMSSTSLVALRLVGAAVAFMLLQVKLRQLRKILVDPLRADFSAQSNTGNLLIVTNCLLYGAYIALSKDLFKRYGALNVITWMFCIGFLAIVPFGAYALSGDELQILPASVWLAVIYIILVPTLIAGLLIFAGVGVVIKRGRSQAVKQVAERPDALAH